MIAYSVILRDVMADRGMENDTVKVLDCDRVWATGNYRFRDRDMDRASML